VVLIDVLKNKIKLIEKTHQLLWCLIGKKLHFHAGANRAKNKEF
jgi:hypothetical protein